MHVIISFISFHVQSWIHPSNLELVTRYRKFKFHLICSVKNEELLKEFKKEERKKIKSKSHSNMNGINGDHYTVEFQHKKSLT